MRPPPVCLTDDLPDNWRQWKVAQLVKFLEPYGTPYRHSSTKARLIRVIETLIAEERQRKSDFSKGLKSV